MKACDHDGLKFLNVAHERMSIKPKGATPGRKQHPKISYIINIIMFFIRRHICHAGGLLTLSDIFFFSLDFLVKFFILETINKGLFQLGRPVSF